MLIDEFNQLAKRIKPVEIARFRCAMTGERLFIAVLSGCPFRAHGELCAMCLDQLHNIGTIVFRPLVGMDDSWGGMGLQGILERADDQKPIVIAQAMHAHHFAATHINHGRYVDECAAVAEIGEIGTSPLIGAKHALLFPYWC